MKHDPTVFSLSPNDLDQLRENIAAACITMTGDHQIRAFRLRDLLDKFDPAEAENLEKQIKELEENRDELKDASDFTGVRDALKLLKEHNWKDNLFDSVSDAVENWKSDIRAELRKHWPSDEQADEEDPRTEAVANLLSADHLAASLADYVEVRVNEYLDNNINPALQDAADFIGDRT